MVVVVVVAVLLPSCCSCSCICRWKRYEVLGVTGCIVESYSVVDCVVRYTFTSRGSCCSNRFKQAWYVSCTSRCGECLMVWYVFVMQ